LAVEAVTPRRVGWTTTDSVDLSYPATDMYDTVRTFGPGGQPGAVHATEGSPSFLLTYEGLGGSVTPTVGGNLSGIVYPSGTTVELTATPAPGATFLYWEVNGVRDVETLTATFTIDKETKVRAFCGLMVTKKLDGLENTPGDMTLRGAINLLNAGSGGFISFDNALKGDTLVLTMDDAAYTSGGTTALGISKTIRILGNQTTLRLSQTQRRFLYISAGANVEITGIHFTGLSTTAGTGVAIDNRGTLTLKSCVFTNNATVYGAIINYYQLNLYGCTFYNNKSNNTGTAGAIYNNGAGQVVNLAGNFFWGSTSGTSTDRYHIYNNGGILNSYGYNQFDYQYSYSSVALTGEGMSGGSSVQRNFFVAPGDTAIDPTLLLSAQMLPATLRPIKGRSLEHRIDLLPANYPTADFYGDPISVVPKAAAGAVQQPTDKNHIITLSYTGIGAIAESSTVIDGLGMVDNGATLSILATPTITNSNSRLTSWTINGTASANSVSGPITYTINSVQGDYTIRANFNFVVVNTLDAGPGSLRDMVAQCLAVGGGDIYFADSLVGKTIKLETRINIPVTTNPANGNINIIAPYVSVGDKGITLDGQGKTQLIYTSGGGTLTMERIRFTNGYTLADLGSAVRAEKIIVLKSCIFDNNLNSSPSTNYGGALNVSTNATLLGCSFVSNTGVYGAGLTTRGGTTYVQGCVFDGNASTLIPPQSSAVYLDGGTFSSGGYNVYNGGNNFTTAAQFAATDRMISSSLTIVDRV
jgi:hypothetical protein